MPFDASTASPGSGLRHQHTGGPAGVRAIQDVDVDPEQLPHPRKRGIDVSPVSACRRRSSGCQRQPENPPAFVAIAASSVAALRRRPRHRRPTSGVRCTGRGCARRTPSHQTNTARLRERRHRAGARRDGPRCAAKPSAASAARARADSGTARRAERADVLLDARRASPRGRAAGRGATGCATRR